MKGGMSYSKETRDFENFIKVEWKKKWRNS